VQKHRCERFRSRCKARIFSESLTAGIDVLQEQIPGNYPALGQPIDELALAEIKGAILAKLRLAIGKDAGMATRRDWYKAAALALRDRIVHRWLMAKNRATMPAASGSITSRSSS
jgi:hypothetical protein